MRYSQSEKMEIIRLVEDSALSVKQTLNELGVAKSNFYRWYSRYDKEGYAGLANKPPNARRFWNKIPEEEDRWNLVSYLQKTFGTTMDFSQKITQLLN